MVRRRPRAAATAVKSADRTIDLLEYLADTSEPPGFAQMSRALAIPKSSLSQLLATLTARGYVSFDTETAGYRLGEKVARLARRAATRIPTEQILLQAMEKLRDQVNESVAFYVRDGDEAKVTLSVACRHALVYTMTVGDRAPLYAMSAGKVILSRMSEDELKRYLARTVLDRLAPNTISKKAALRREIEVVRRNRIATACEELAVGIRGMAVPIETGDHLLGALNVAIPVARYTDQLGTAIKFRLQSTANELATALASGQSRQKIHRAR